MLLYHGTRFTAFLSIKEKGGIIPRTRKKQKGNWEDFPSVLNHVYLTTAYPFYFARAALKGQQTKGMVLEIDTDRIDEHSLYPDEDFLGQVIARQQGIPLEEAHALGVKLLKSNQHLWKDSVEGIGNCSYFGAIPTDAVTRICIFDFKKRSGLDMATNDPSISIMNYTFLGQEYRDTVAWMFGDVPTLSAFERKKEWMKRTAKTKEQKKFVKESIERMDAEQNNRDGIEVIRMNERILK